MANYWEGVVFMLNGREFNFQVAQRDLEELSRIEVGLYVQCTVCHGTSVATRVDACRACTINTYIAMAEHYMPLLMQQLHDLVYERQR